MINKTAVIISSEFPPGPGGIGKHAFDLANALSWKEYRVTVFTSQDFSTQSEIDRFVKTIPSGISINRFKRTGASTYWKRWSQINHSLKRQIPDLIIVTGRFSLWMGYLVKIIYGRKIPVHAFIHGSELSNANKLYYFFTRRALLAADYRWAVSTFTRQQTGRHINNKEVRVLPNGLWMEDWHLAEAPKEAIVLKGNPVLLTVGRISSRKGQHRVVNALATVQNYFPGIHYHMAGIPEGKDVLFNQAQQLAVESRLSFHGRIPSDAMLAGYYKAADIFIMLSENQKNGDTEGFGIAILEANLFGKPAIGAKGCGIEDAITDGYNGRLVDGDNAQEIVEAIQDIMNNYEAYSKRAKNWALKHDWKILIERFEKKDGYLESDKSTFTK